MVKELIILIFNLNEKDLVEILNNLLMIQDINKNMNLNMKKDMIQNIKEVYHCRYF